MDQRQQDSLHPGRGDGDVRGGSILPATLTLREIVLDKQGYDQQGQYWGVGLKLFWYHIDIPSLPNLRNEGWVRRRTKLSARAWVKRHHPQLNLRVRGVK